MANRPEEQELAANRQLQNSTPSNKSYQSTLVAFMSFFRNVPFNRTHLFSADDLNVVSPQDIVRWMNVKAFGEENPPDSANPLYARSSSLEFWKKALSFYMPNRLIPWNTISNSGNPTKSTNVNDLIKRVKKKEVRKQGVAPQSRRSMKEPEFRVLRMVLQKMDNGNEIVMKLGIPALINYQFHLIARIDDATQLLIEHVCTHNFYPNALKSKLNWSKNVSEERDAPWQIVLGSMESAFCVLVSMALWMEANLARNPSAMSSPYVFSFSNDIEVPGGGQKSKVLVQKIFGQTIFKMDEFTGREGGVAQQASGAGAGAGGLLGSHSIRKFAATHTRLCGCTKDEKDIRGRWKSRKRISDVYDDVELPYPDAKVANRLCIGGPCYYVMDGELEQTGSGTGDSSNNNNNSTTCMLTMMTSFILGAVVPNIRKRMSESCTLVLGKALLWYLFSPECMEACEYIPVLAAMRHQVRRQFFEIARAADVSGIEEVDYNPIRKVPVIVSGDQGSVMIETLDADVLAGTPGHRVGGVGSAAAIQDQLLAIQSSLSQVRRDANESKNSINMQFGNINNQLLIMNGNFKRMGKQPVRMMAEAAAVSQEHEGGAANCAAPPLIASLSDAPRSLYELWEEYQVGIGGRKPAKQFTHHERGRVKHRYHLRNIVWQVILGLVRQGHSDQRAIDLIYNIYGGGTSVTNVIRALKRDIKGGTLSPTLRI